MRTSRPRLGLGSMAQMRGGCPRSLVVIFVVLLMWTEAAVGHAAEPDASPSSPPAAGSSPAPDTAALDLRDDGFTSKPDPLTIATELSRDERVRKVIGPKGGTLKTTAFDGTRYELVIPAGALVYPATIGMTPISDIGGLPGGAPPDRVLGVQLEPDGLLLPDPGTLTMRLPKGPDPALAVLDYEGEGSETGFHRFSTEGRSITVPIDHFSGYVATFPIEVERIRAIAAFTRTDPARVLASDIAEAIALDRQRALLLDAESELPRIAAHYLPIFVEAVLNPKIAVAGRSCADAEAAMAALLSYQRQRRDPRRG